MRDVGSDVVQGQVRWGSSLGAVVVALARRPATAVGDGGHGFGRMGPAYARTTP